MTDLIAAVGKTRDSNEVLRVLDSISPVRVSEDPPFREYRGSPSKGLDLLFESERVISVQIYTQSTRVFSAYSADLPFGLRADMSQADVHALMGTPVTYNEISSKYSIPERAVKVVVTYDEALHMRRISLGVLDSQVLV